MLWGDRGEGVLGDHVPKQVVGDKLDRGTDDVDKGYSCVDSGCTVPDEGGSGDGVSVSGTVGDGEECSVLCGSWSSESVCACGAFGENISARDNWNGESASVCACKNIQTWSLEFCGGDGG